MAQYTGQSHFSTKKKIPVRVGKTGFLSSIFSRFTQNKQYLKLPEAKSNHYYRPSLVRRKSSFEKTTGNNYKVFKPANDVFLKDKVKQTINLGIVKKFAFGYKNLDFIERNTSILNAGNLLKNLNFLLVKWQIARRLNQLIAVILLFGTLISLVYISFFDKFFLVKTYSISFADKSYLDQEQINELTRNINQNKLFGFLPYNGYWFINDHNLTSISQKLIPEVESVTVTNRGWPNKVDLKIKTEPILLTLGIIENTQKKYWRISQQGKILSEDDLNLRENLVEVNKIVTFDKPGSSLKDYSLEENTADLNRFWFVIWLWSIMKELNLVITKTTFPTLLDSDVELTTITGSRLLFDSTSLSQDNQYKRILGTLNTIVGGKSIRDKLDTGGVNYIDFRIPKRVFVCDTGKECNSKE